MANEQKLVPASVFVEQVIERGKQDKGFAAMMKRADNPKTAYQSYEFMVSMGIPIDNERLWQPHALIASALSKSKIMENGNAGLGEALASSFKDNEKPDGSQNKKQQKEAKPGSSRLRRLLACDSIQEICQILRPMLPFIEDKTASHIDYAQLLQELRYFEKDSDNIRKRWAMQFYGTSGKAEDDEQGVEA